jgi:hypothetical protein
VPGGEIYFIVNHGSVFTGKVSFPHPRLTPEIWDADTGGIAIAGEYRTDAERIYITLSIEPYDSALVVLNDVRGTVRASDKSSLEPSGAWLAELPISGPWRLHADTSRCKGITASVDLSLKQLMSWRDLPQLEACAGIVTYTTRIVLPPGSVRDDRGWLLDLGRVYELAQVTLNRRIVGSSWTAPYRIDVTGFLHEGPNEIELDIPNLLEGHLDQAEHTRPSGLLGPVVLRSYARTSAKPSTPNPKKGR